MKFKIYGMVLSLFFGLGLVFSFGIDASASHCSDEDETNMHCNQNIAAGDVDVTSEEDVRAFLEHIGDYYDLVFEQNSTDEDALTRELLIYGREIRKEGVYKDSDKGMYSLGINEREIVTNHAGYPGLFGYVFKPDAADSEVASTIKTLRESAVDGMTACETYGTENRVACAVKVVGPSGTVTAIAGLHHGEDDSAFAPPDCTGFELETSAEDVYNDSTDENLEAYVEDVIEIVQRETAAITNAQLTEFREEGKQEGLLAGDPALQNEFRAKIIERSHDKVACYGSGDFSHENIYIFIMEANQDSPTVFVNGNDFDLNGANLELEDDELPGDDKSIAGLFNRALGGGTSAYANYRWDDPSTAEDDVADFFQNGKVPGTSCKRSYIEVANINKLLTGFPAAPYTFGSGTYPGDDVCAGDDDDAAGDDDDAAGDDDDAAGDDDDAAGDDDDGGACAIAGTGHTPQGSLFNLFLIASVLFSVFFLRRRA